MAKFCTKCGKPLEEGEVCSCMAQAVKNETVQPVQEPAEQQAPQGNARQVQYQQAPQGNAQQEFTGANGRTKEAEWINEKKDAVISVTKNMFAEIAPILKAPVSRVRTIAEEKNTKVGISFIITKMVIALVIMLLGVVKLKSMLGYASEYIKIPYFSLILLIIIFTVGADFLEVLLLKIFAGIFNGVTHFSSMITVVGARDLYHCMILILTGVLLIISPQLALAAAVICSLLATYIEYSGYAATVQNKEDKKPYSFFAAKACCTIIIYIIMIVFVKSVMAEIMSSSLGGWYNFF